MAEILGIDILRELDGKVRTEHLKIVRKWSKQRKPLSERHEEVLREILYADIGRAVVDHYKNSNTRIKGIKYWAWQNIFFWSFYQFSQLLSRSHN